ncbi:MULTISPECIES: hypothetical protein [Vibrio]|uniref:hypothetical protein n=1 Tax=Vibrio TaxID=662 RepID=UPI0008412ECD|nr:MULTISPECIES: hypothetical protein [Vibrio]ODM56865.1 hypothetical protein BC455_18570 [Vibrio harveyi]USD58494.1 hypothetical protein J4N44_27765 [Vibrio sp. SCSIO 43155]
MEKKTKIQLSCLFAAVTVIVALKVGNQKPDRRVDNISEANQTQSVVKEDSRTDTVITSKSNDAQGSVIETPLDVQPKIIIKEPEVLTLEELPVLTGSDLDFLQSLAEDRERDRELKQAKHIKEIARLTSETSKYNGVSEAASNTANVRGITQGKVPATLVAKTAAPQIADTSTVEKESKQEEQIRQRTPPREFFDISISSFSYSNGQYNVWLQNGDGILPVDVNVRFGPQIVTDITSEYVRVLHEPTGYARLIGVNTGIQAKLREKDEKVAEEPKPNSVAAIKLRKLAEKNN